MRIFELVDTNSGLDKFIMLLRNYRGRAASKKVPAKYNWAAVEQMARKVGFEFAADYKTFKQIYDSTPGLQELIKNFNDRGMELDVPGAPDSENPSQTSDQDQISADAVAQTAASNVNQQISQNQQGVKI